MKSPEPIYFVSGDIYRQSTGGTLCDRMIVEELKRERPVKLLVPQIESLFRFERPLIAGLINNLRNLFRIFPQRALLFMDHGVYRDCFIAGHVWKWLYRCRVVGVVYHLDYQLEQMKGGKTLRRLIEELQIGIYDFCLTISHDTATHLQRLRCPADRIALIPISRRFLPQPPRPPRSAEEVTLLFVGTIEPRKGLKDAVQALANAKAARRIVFNCVGQCDRESDYVRELISLAKNSSGFTFNLTGRVDEEELKTFYKNSDVFLFPSHWEGYGIAIEEAMCFGLPVIAYRAGAVSELVEHGVSGWLVSVGDSEALTRAIRDCVDNSGERARRGREALARATQLTASRPLEPILQQAIAVAN